MKNKKSILCSFNRKAILGVRSHVFALCSYILSFNENVFRSSTIYISNTNNKFSRKVVETSPRRRALVAIYIRYPHDDDKTFRVVEGRYIIHIYIYTFCGEKLKEVDKCNNMGGGWRWLVVVLQRVNIRNIRVIYINRNERFCQEIG